MWKRKINRKRFCQHTWEDGRSSVGRKASWNDTAGLRWVEDECRRCGRLWRTRQVWTPRFQRRAA